MNDGRASGKSNRRPSGRFYLSVVGGRPNHRQSDVGPCGGYRAVCDKPNLEPTKHARLQPGERRIHIDNSRNETIMYRAIETYRGLVYPWTIDHVGHMNVQSYTGRFDEASWQFLGRLGLSPLFLKRHDRAAVAADQRTQYKREVMAGSLLHITTELLHIGRKSIRCVHRMYDSEVDEEVASTELVGVYFDTLNRVPVELPATVHERAAALLATPHAQRISVIPIGDGMRSSA